MKNLYIAEKPSVARQFAEALGVKNAGNTSTKEGFIETADSVFTWCYGHLVTMSYPDAYDPNLKKWTMDTIPFVPDDFLYEVIPSAANQFRVVERLLNREDIGCIYVCTDSGREGEYIYRLVDAMAKVPKDKPKKRVWIDSQTEEEIKRGIAEAKDISAYDHLSDAAYLRAQEDYLMGINFSRALSLKFSYPVKQYLGLDKCVIAVGRVMTCVLGMIVKREREIREFVPTPFYRVIAGLSGFEAEWKTSETSAYLNSPLLYKENGFKKREDAEGLIAELATETPTPLTVSKVEKKTEKKAPSMLYNLAELQNDCSKILKISPSDTLAIAQELYEKKLTTYPRTDARVLSTAVAKVIDKNLNGLKHYQPVAAYADHIVSHGGYKGLASSKYVNDKAITDHYAIIPTGQGFGALNGLSANAAKVYDMIAKRFVSIFYPAAEYEKVSLTLTREIQTTRGEKDTGTETFQANFKRLKKPGYLTIVGIPQPKKDEDGEALSEERLAELASLKKGSTLLAENFSVKEGETTPPKRYSSGTLILAMENAGQLIEDEELRAQIKGSGIGTSATRDSIITKLVNNTYIALNKKTQIVTPTFLGEIIYDVCLHSINSLLRAEMTASWEKGLSGVADGSIDKEEYKEKMNRFVAANTNLVKQIRNQNQITAIFDRTRPYYEKAGTKKTAGKKG